MLRIFIFVAIALVASAVEASACTCLLSKNGKSEVRKAKDAAATVFIGRVVEIREHERQSGSRTEILYQTVFEISRAWKGVSQARVSVFARKDEGMCGKSFERGHEYLVYGGTSDRVNAFSDHLCSRTRLASGEGLLKEIKYLGKQNLQLKRERIVETWESS